MPLPNVPDKLLLRTADDTADDMLDASPDRRSPTELKPLLSAVPTELKPLLSAVPTSVNELTSSFVSSL